MDQRSLRDIHLEHDHYVSDKWEIYLNEYHSNLQGMRHLPIRLLEIGVQNGGSLEVWSKYFQNAQKIVGVDINPDCAKLSFDDPRISLIIGDANSENCEQQISERSPEYDVIIDDGSHRSSDIVKSFCKYFPRLTNEGIFIAEDLHCSYWHQFEGGLYDRYSSMSFFKRLCDVVNHEHWGIDNSRVSHIQPILDQYESLITEDLLESIHSITFFNSVCIIRKKHPSANVLGARLVSGHEEIVVGGHLQIKSQRSRAIDQTSTPNRKIDQIKKDVAQLETLLQESQQQLLEYQSKTLGPGNLLKRIIERIFK
jgi:O-antigen biosynthesis protein